MAPHSLLLSLLSATALLTPLSAAAETVLGAYIFARHGDRTPKSIPPTVLTELGYSQVHSTGSYFRSRYVANDSSLRIQGISPDIVGPGQLAASAPQDEVLQKSATGFFQGLYPPVGSEATAASTLRNGSTVDVPLDGYQLVAVEQVESGKDSENTAWLQGTSDCHNAKVSSDNYLSSAAYEGLLDSTADFYKSLTPMLDRTFTPDEINYENAYQIFDLLNVASIHNSTEDFPSDDLLTDETYARLLHLANTHQFNLAWNASDPIRGVEGATLATDILSALRDFIDSRGSGSKPKLSVQFGAYANFLSFFGLADLPSADVDFTGIPDYASSMAFELITDSDSDDGDDFPDPADINVRFLFRNGTIVPGDSNTEPTAFPLFGQSETTLPWSEFARHMEEISIPTQEEWCKRCGSSSGNCAAMDDDASSSSSSSDSSGGNGISRATAGVIGAFVTLGVIIIVQALLFFVGGFRLVHKSRAKGSTPAGSQAEKASL